METPLFTHLMNYHAKNRISFAMPGHKNCRGINRDLLLCDVTELKETEDLYNPHEYIKRSNRLLSELFGSYESFILTGGSTLGIQAMIASCLTEGDTLLASGDCHKSVVNACALLGIRLKIMPIEIDSDFLIPTRIKDIEKYIDGVNAVIVTSPNYYGICEDIEEISRICREKNIPLLVDEAHGAHFVSSRKFPKPAIQQGADVVVESAHKTLNALNGAAFLHVKSQIISAERVKKSLAAFGSTSPSYIIASSADIARAELAGGGWDTVCGQCDEFRGKIKQTDIKILENDDPTRLVLNFSAYDTTGFDIEDELSNRGIDIEMSDYLNIVLIVTPSNTKSDLDALYDALLNIVSDLKPRGHGIDIEIPPNCEDVLNPKTAFFAKTKLLLLQGSIGKISASAVTAYPPGIPIIYTGEKITAEKTDYIERIKNSGAKITGLNNNLIETVKGQ